MPTHHGAAVGLWKVLLTQQGPGRFAKSMALSRCSRRCRPIRRRLAKGVLPMLLLLLPPPLLPLALSARLLLLRLPLAETLL